MAVAVLLPTGFRVCISRERRRRRREEALFTSRAFLKPGGGFVRMDVAMAAGGGGGGQWRGVRGDEARVLAGEFFTARGKRGGGGLRQVSGAERRVCLCCVRRHVEEGENWTRGKMLSEVSSWGIGGPAKYFVEVTDAAQMAAVLRHCHRQQLRYFVLGKGSNCLFDDRGYDGLVLLNRIDFLESHGNGVFRVGSGHAFNLLGLRSSKDGFTGLEFASGIPGTIGGAVYMNAGADGQQTSDTLRSVEMATADAEMLVLSKEEGHLQYGYRCSPFQKMKDFRAITAATFELSACPEARERQRLFLDRRKRSQPVTERSAGCVFRNPGAGALSAGALIEQAGLKGARVGDAKVSDLHANFLVNAGRSSCSDMLSLISLVKKRVSDACGIDLLEEIICVPYSDSQPFVK